MMSRPGLEPFWSKQEPSRSRPGAAAATDSARTRSRLEVRRTHALATAARNFLRSPESSAGAAEDSAPPPAPASASAVPGAPRALQPRGLAGVATGRAMRDEHQADAELPAAGGHGSSSPQHSAAPGRQSLQPEPATSGSGVRGEESGQQGDGLVHAPATWHPSAARHGPPRRSRERVRQTHALANAARSVWPSCSVQHKPAERREWLVNDTQQRRGHSSLWLDPVC